MKCVVCNEEFEGARSTAKYCSDKCKQESYRNKEGEVSVTEGSLSVTKPVTVTDKAVTLKKEGIMAKVEKLKERTGRMLSITKANRYHWTYFENGGSVRKGSERVFGECEKVDEFTKGAQCQS